MKTSDCKSFDSCSEPICPLYEYNGVWFADEEICRSKQYCSNGWIRNQKKIAKRTRDFDTYYTYKMLQHDCIIGKGITGLNPDNDITDMEKDETRWFKEHPEKRILSEEVREKLKNRLEEGRRGLIPPEKDVIRYEKSNKNMPSAEDFMT